MAALLTIGVIGKVLGAVGSAVSAFGTIAAGGAQKSAAEFQAKQLEVKASEEKAASQREAARVRKERDFILSRQQAVAASSNLGALDETVQDLAGDVVQEGAYQEAMVRYGGDERAKGLRAQAAAARLEGKAAQTGSYFSAGGTILGGLGTFASDYSKATAPASTTYRYGAAPSADPWYGYR